MQEGIGQASIVGETDGLEGGAQQVGVEDGLVAMEHVICAGALEGVVDRQRQAAS